MAINTLHTGLRSSRGANRTRKLTQTHSDKRGRGGRGAGTAANIKQLSMRDKEHRANIKTWDARTADKKRVDELKKKCAIKKKADEKEVIEKRLAEAAKKEEGRVARLGEHIASAISFVEEAAQVFIVGLGKKTLLAEVSLEMTGAELKQLLEHRTRVPADYMGGLYYESRPIADECRLASYHIGKDSTIEVKARGRGGAEKPSACPPSPATCPSSPAPPTPSCQGQSPCVVDAEVVATLAEVQQLAATLNVEKLDVPQIGVLGSQSAGKSSVIESLVGMTFLPRGTGIVTRCPLYVHLRPRESGDADYGVFVDPNDPDDRVPVTDIGLVREKIEERTAALAGASKDVCATPIVLELHVANAPALTLVDLPGVTRVPVCGQPEDTSDRIRAMCMDVAKNPRAVLLCVSAATEDLANSAALELAREADPQRDRTIGVLTKADLMETGTNCSAVLRNKVFPLQLGYVAVVCRGQSDLDVGASVHAARERERRFFDDHPVYRTHQLRQLCGTDRLSAQLSRLLVAAIREAAPEMRNRCRAELDEVEQRAAQLGDVASEDPAQVVTEVVLFYADAYTTLIREGTVDAARWLGDDKMVGSARVAHIFEHVFAGSLMAADPLDGISDDDVRSCLAATRGATPALFAPEKAFHALVRQQIAKLCAPGLECVDGVGRELENCAAHMDIVVAKMAKGAPGGCTTRAAKVLCWLRRAPRLRAAIREAIVEIVRAAKSPARERVQDLVDCELQHTNTRHPDFVAAIADVAVRLAGGVSPGDAVRNSLTGASGVVQRRDAWKEGKVAVQFESKAEVKLVPLENLEYLGGGGVSDDGAALGVDPAPSRWPWGSRGLPASQRCHRHKSFVLSDKAACPAPATDVDIVNKLVRAYFCIVRKTFCDLVPKIVMTHVVKSVEEKLKATLVGRFAAEPHAQLLAEDEETEREREEVMRKRDGLRKMLRLLDTF